MKLYTSAFLGILVGLGISRFFPKQPPAEPPTVAAHHRRPIPAQPPAPASAPLSEPSRFLEQYRQAMLVESLPSPQIAPRIAAILAKEINLRGFHVRRSDEMELECLFRRLLHEDEAAALRLQAEHGRRSIEPFISAWASLDPAKASAWLATQPEQKFSRYPTLRDRIDIVAFGQGAARNLDALSPHAAADVMLSRWQQDPAAVQALLLARVENPKVDALFRAMVMGPERHGMTESGIRNLAPQFAFDLLVAGPHHFTADDAETLGRALRQEARQHEGELERWRLLARFPVQFLNTQPLRDALHSAYDVPDGATTQDQRIDAIAAALPAEKQPEFAELLAAIQRHRRG